jgi:HSP20 family protein
MNSESAICTKGEAMLPSLFQEEGLFPMMKLRGGIDRLFEDFFTDEKALAPFPFAGKALPRLDVKETDLAITVDAELPGLKQEEIRVTVEEGVLTIAAERKEEKDEKTRSVHRLERYYGKMERKLALPATVEDGKVDALYKDGVLHVMLPKKPSAKPKAVTVKVK